MKKDWGFSAFIEYNGKRILFDTGNNGEIFSHNVNAKGIDLTDLDFAVLSHRHGDHTSGLNHLMTINPNVPIYAPKESFGVFGAALPGNFYDAEQVKEFARRNLQPGDQVHTHGLAAMVGLREAPHHVPKTTPPELAPQWLPWVHVLIANLNRFILGTYHGVSERYIHEYIDEFMYRFNRRFRESHLSNRLIRLAVEHPPVPLRSA